MTDARLNVVALLLGAVLPSIGCGSDPGAAGSCGKVQPCGGDIVGDWRVVADCVNDAVLSMKLASDFGASCPTVTGHANVTETGSFTFSAGLSFSASATVAGTVDMNIPASCLAGSTCADVNAAIQADLAANPSPGITSVSCLGSSACTCRFTVGPVPLLESGTYTTAGTTLTLTSAADGSVDQGGYCINGTTGHLMTLVMSMPMGSMGTMTIDEDTVMVRQ
jgi:hypothetical protein